MRETLPESTDDGLDPLIFRRNKRPNAEQIDNYLLLLASGHSHGEAAHKVGSTGTAFRALTRRDPGFANRRHIAETLHLEGRDDRIRHSLFTRAFEEGHWEALKLLAEIYLPELEYRRTRKSETKIEGTIAHLLNLTPEQLATIPDAKLDALIAAAEDVQRLALEPGHPVIDAA